MKSTPKTSKGYLILAFFGGMFLTFNLVWMLNRYSVLDHEPIHLHNDDTAISSSSFCPTCGPDCQDSVAAKQKIIDELNVKLREQIVVQPPKLPEEAQNMLADHDLLGNDARVKSNVVKTGDDKDVITPWSEYDDQYKELHKTLNKEFLPEDFIVAIVTANRPQYLGATLRSLQQVLYWNKTNTVIYQYGDDKRINMIANSYEIKQVKNPVVVEFQGKAITEGAEHIAIHYRFVMDHVFANNPKARYFLIVEDDMIFAPDILLYFAQVGPLMDKDPTIYSISAYNDNGFAGRVEQDNMVYRTDFFIGLGWLVSRRHWEEEWRQSWPRTHWDHFLRNPMNRKERQTLYPEISRIYHSGYRGTHSTVALYEKYFRDIKLNLHGYVPMGVSKEALTEGKYRYEDLETTEPKTVQYLEADQYKKFFQSIIDPSAKNVVYLETMEGVDKYKNKHLVIPYDAQILINRAWMHISEYFDVWHTVPVRSEYLGITHFRWMNGNVVFMMATYSIFYEQFETFFKKPKPILVPVEQFQLEPPWLSPKKDSVLSISTAEKGQSCSALCTVKFGESSKCDLFKISELNSCRSLKKYFQCESCGGNIGHDQPAIDLEEKKCLYNTGSRQYMTTCEGSHPKTQRLCACFDPKTVVTFHEEWETMIATAQKQAVSPNS